MAAANDDRRKEIETAINDSRGHGWNPIDVFVDGLVQRSPAETLDDDRKEWIHRQSRLDTAIGTLEGAAEELPDELTAALSDKARKSAEELDSDRERLLHDGADVSSRSPSRSRRDRLEQIDTDRTSRTSRTSVESRLSDSAASGRSGGGSVSNTIMFWSFVVAFVYFVPDYCNKLSADADAVLAQRAPGRRTVVSTPRVTDSVVKPFRRAFAQHKKGIDAPEPALDPQLLEDPFAGYDDDLRSQLDGCKETKPKLYDKGPKVPKSLEDPCAGYDDDLRSQLNGCK